MFDNFGGQRKGSRQSEARGFKADFGNERSMMSASAPCGSGGLQGSASNNSIVSSRGPRDRSNSNSNGNAPAQLVGDPWGDRNNAPARNQPAPQNRSSPPRGNAPPPASHGSPGGISGAPPPGEDMVFDACVQRKFKEKMTLR